MLADRRHYGCTAWLTHLYALRRALSFCWESATVNVDAVLQPQGTILGWICDVLRAGYEAVEFLFASWIRLVIVCGCVQLVLGSVLVPQLLVFHLCNVSFPANGLTSATTRGLVNVPAANRWLRNGDGSGWHGIADVRMQGVMEPNTCAHGLLATESALHVAVGAGNQRAVKRRLDAGASRSQGTAGFLGLVYSTTPLFKASATTHNQGTASFLGLVYSATPLFKASATTTIVEELLRAGANPDQGSTAGPFGLLETNTPLIAAVMEGHVDIVKALLKAGASPEKGSTLGPFGLLYTATPLVVAVKEGYTDIVNELLRAGASPDQGLVAGPFGQLATITPLVVAAEKGHTDIVKELLKAGASPEN